MEQNTPINQENITAEDYYKLIKESKFEEMNLIFNSINEGKSFEIVSKEVGRSNRETRNMFQLASYYFKKYGKIEKQNKVNIQEMLEELKIKIQKDEAFDVSLEKSSKKEIRNYRRKQNLKRFYTPQEWFKLLKQIKNEKHKFLIEFLLHTGSRINEARGVRITDIDFDREQIILRKTKGGIKKNRTIQISTYLVGRIKSYISSQKIESKLDTLNFPSTVMMDKMVKRYTKLAGIEDWEDFSNHNIRKTVENWLCALNINHLSIQAHMGHTLDVAAAHYVSTQLLNGEDKSLIRAILDNLLQK